MNDNADRDQSNEPATVTYALELMDYKRIVKARELAEVLNTTHQEVHKMVREERLKGSPIIGCGRGYYLAKTREELKSYLQRYRQRLNRLGEIYNVLLKIYKSMPEDEN